MSNFWQPPMGPPGMYPQQMPQRMPHQMPGMPGMPPAQQVVEPMWTPVSYGWIPGPHHVRGGFDIAREPLYVGRGSHCGDLIPGKVNPNHGPACYVAHGGREHKTHQFEVLTVHPGTELYWAHSSHGQVPAGAVRGGHTAQGEPLYICRHMQSSSMVIGKVQPSHGCGYIGFDGREIAVKTYEILCFRPTYGYM